MSSSHHKLNSEQLEAAHYTHGHILVLAGAGTGKTTMLLHRFLYLIQNSYCTTHQILMTTFTSKAAEEMKKRIAMYDYEPEWIGTFHSLCGRIVRAHADKLGLDKSFQMIDGEAQKYIMHKLFALKADEIDEQIQQWKNQLLTCSDISTTEPHYKSYQLYQKTLKEENQLDFSDLIILCCKLWENHVDILAQYQACFKYICVDEFQDTNYAQMHWLKLLLGITNSTNSHQPHLTHQSRSYQSNHSTFKNQNTSLHENNINHPAQHKDISSHFMPNNASINPNSSQNYISPNVTSSHSIQDNIDSSLHSYISQSMHISSDHFAHIFCVGDDDQMIYSWRNTNSAYILDFQLIFKDAKIIKLRQNYRSTQSILRGALDIVSKNSKRFHKVLLSNRSQDFPIIIKSFLDDVQEAKWIAQDIMQNINIINLQKINTFHSIDHLFYSHTAQNANNQSQSSSTIHHSSHNNFTQEQDNILHTSSLETSHTPHINPIDQQDSKQHYTHNADTITSQQSLSTNPSIKANTSDIITIGILLRTIWQVNELRKTLSEYHITDKSIPLLLEHMRFIYTLHHKHLIKILDMTKRGIGAKTLEKFEEICSQNLYNQYTFSSQSYSYSNDQSNSAFLSANTSDQQIFFLHQTLLQTVRTKTQEEGVHALFALISTWISLKHNIRELMILLCKQLQIPNLIGNLLLKTALNSKTVEDFVQNYKTPQIHLMTIHASKGLEFDIVYLPGWEEKIFPHVKALLIDSIDEERRLAYVAITRARLKVHITYAMLRQSPRGLMKQIPSRFISDIHSSVIQND